MASIPLNKTKVIFFIPIKTGYGFHVKGFIIFVSKYFNRKKCLAGLKYIANQCLLVLS
jgi:hypothetical protein